MLLHSKAHLINSHILHLTYTLVGTVDSERSATISNPIAFRDLLASKTIHYSTVCFWACLLEHLDTDVVFHFPLVLVIIIYIQFADMLIWRTTSEAIQRSLFNHFYDLLSHNR